MWKKFSFSGNYKWLPIIQSLIKDYNSIKHSTTKLPPEKITKKNENSILRNIYNEPKIFQKSKYKVGNFVRISKHKGHFEKGYQPNWSTEVFKIDKINNTYPITYQLTDYTDTPISGGFYQAELTPVKDPDTYLVEKILKKQGNRVFVKWLGFDKTHNTWINKKDII